MNDKITTMLLPSRRTCNIRWQNCLVRNCIRTNIQSYRERWQISCIPRCKRIVAEFHACFSYEKKFPGIKVSTSNEVHNRIGNHFSIKCGYRSLNFMLLTRICSPSLQQFPKMINVTNHNIIRFNKFLQNPSTRYPSLPQQHPPKPIKLLTAYVHVLRMSRIILIRSMHTPNIRKRTLQPQKMLQILLKSELSRRITTIAQ